MSDQLRERVRWDIDEQIQVIPYAVNRLQSLYLISPPTPFRDVSFGTEETGASPFDIDVVLQRLAPEIEFGPLPNRFLVEQLLPLSCLLPGIHDFVTERSTPHLLTTAALVQQLTNREVRIDSTDVLCRVRVV